MMEAFGVATTPVCWSCWRCHSGATRSDVLLHCEYESDGEQCLGLASCWLTFDRLQEDLNKANYNNNDKRL